VTYAC